MSLFPWFPFTNFHELNLDWILKKLKGYDDKIDDVNKRMDDIEALLENLDDTIEEVAERVLDEAIDDGKFDDALAELVQPIQDELDGFESSVNTSISEIRTLVGNNTQAVQDIAQDMTDFETQVNLQLGNMRDTIRDNNQVAVLRQAHKNILIIGDSYAYGVGVNTGFVDLIAQQGVFGHVYSYAIQGAGFTGKKSGADLPTHAGNPDLTFKKAVSAWLSTSEGARVKNDIDTVLVIGGFNDFYSDGNDIRDAIIDFCSYALQRIPNATFYLAFCGWCGYGYNGTGVLHLPAGSPVRRAKTSWVRRRLTRFVEPYYSGASVYGLNYLGNATGCLHSYSTSFLSDGYHPSSEGHTSLAKWVINRLCGGAGYVPAYRTLECIYNPSYETAVPIPEANVISMGTTNSTNEGIYINTSIDQYFSFTALDNVGSNPTVDFNKFALILNNTCRCSVLPVGGDVIIPCMIRGVFADETGNRSASGIIRIHQGTGSNYSELEDETVDGRIGVEIIPTEGRYLQQGYTYNVRMLTCYYPYESC